MALLLIVAATNAFAAEQPLPILVVSKGTVDANELAGRLENEFQVLTTVTPVPRLGGILTVSHLAEHEDLTVTFQSQSNETLTRVVTAEKSTHALIRQAAALSFALIQMKTSEENVSTTTVNEALQVNQSTEKQFQKVIATFSFFWPPATNMYDKEVTSHLDFNILFGRLGALEGFQLGTVNLVTRYSLGVQLSIFGVNHVNGHAEGLQIAPFYNVARDGIHGLGMSAFNFSGARTIGGQIAFLSNVSLNEHWGFQISLGGNYAGGALRGLQTAWGLNIARSGFWGLQVAALNVSHHNSAGIQVGGINVHSKGTYDGIQIGFVNVARKVRGLQLGLVNVSKDIAGIPIGVVSVSESGGVHPTIFSSLSPLLNIGAKFATKYTYSTLLFALDPILPDRDFMGVNRGFRWGFGYLLGVTIPVLPILYFACDIGMTYLYGGAGIMARTANLGDIVQTKLRTTFGFRPVKHFSIFVGAGVNFETQFDFTGPLAVRFRFRPDVFAGLEF